MSLSTWLAFFAASWAISFSPGSGAVSAMSAGLRYGFRRGYWNTVGLIAGILLQILVVGVGLGALLATSEIAFAIVKWLGVAYLIYLGIKQMRADTSPVDPDAPATDGRISTLVLRGFLVNASNPKGTVFLLAVVPQFIAGGQPLLPQYAAIAATLAFTDLVAMAIYTALAARVLRLLRSRRHIRWLNRGFGGLFIAAGAWLATFRHHA
ncbi:threonine transporter RhtB [Verticiella sediminum]|uniref:Threonine transporter RhtB n=1 Tax=Verticiella sediminum TaxID=1247510 RepID=A0A556A874_9BURK|nr:LysE family transporter [Verticiella sediminum]TSH89086.1 threonine transporter RhtB [Verticiella sediminum]